MPRFHLRLIASILALLPATARAQTPAPSAPLPSVALPQELDRVLRDYERAWQAGDAAALAALFAGDGFVLSNGKPAVRGRDAIRAAYQHAGGILRLRALSYAVQDTVGYIIGAYGYGSDSTVLDTGKFILALRRGGGGGGQWLIAGDIDNTNRR
jgi:ketosteroid isomerase-like protein